MKKIVELTILGEPLGKQRPRVSMANGVVRTYTPTKTTNYETLVAHEYMSKYGKMVFGREEPIKAIIDIYFPLNKGDFGKKGLNKSGRAKISGRFATIKSDIDNILKCLFDALNTIAYPDDKQIVEVHAYKMYTLESPQVHIVLESLGEQNEEQ